MLIEYLDEFWVIKSFFSQQPQNVMFKNEGGSKVKLIDFSLTRKFDPQQETKISFGTAEYVGKYFVYLPPNRPLACSPSRSVVEHLVDLLVRAINSLDCKVVRIFAYSSTLEQSNKRSWVRLKTKSETGERHGLRAFEGRTLSACETLKLHKTDFE